MQLVSIDGVLVFVLAEGLTAFIVMVTYLLLRHAKRKQFKYWAVGLIVYIVGITISIFESSRYLGLISGFGFAGILTSTLILYDGTTCNYRKGWNNLIYIVLAVFGLSLCLALSPFNIHFSFLFAPFDIPLFFVLIMTAQELYGIQEISPLLVKISVMGIVFWGLSLLITPFTIFPLAFYAMVIIQSSGLLITGCGLLGLFTEITRKDLDEQHIRSETLSGIVQHDIRNYIQIALSALEMAKISEEHPDDMMDLALESLQDASSFVNEMRTLAAALSGRESMLKVIDIHDTLMDIKRRVSREYDFKDERILVIIPSNTNVLSVEPVREVIWNIIDNAFKHGSTKLLVKIRDYTEIELTLAIADNGGGMDSEAKRFINDGSLSIGKTTSGIGLGFTLINRLAPVCGLKVHVEDNLDDSEVIGTIFLLTFNKPQELQSMSK